MSTLNTCLRAGALAFALGCFSLPAATDVMAASIAGNWKGGGRATGADGKSYRVSCRVSVQARAAKQFFVNGKCTSQKGTATGHGTVKGSGGSYSGSANGVAQFGNGRMSLRSRGKRMSLSIRGKKGRLNVSLRKTR